MEIRSQVLYLRVSDMDRSLEFYRDRLGLALVHQMDDETGIFFARLEAGGFAVMLSNRPSRFLDFTTRFHEDADDHDHDDGVHGHDPALFHGVSSVHDGQLNFVTYVYIDDVDAAYEELVSRGIEVVDPPQDRFYGLREFLLADPDGYFYAFGQRIAEGEIG